MIELAEGHKPLRFTTEHTAPVQTLAFSPDGRHLASGDTARQLVIWQDGQVHLRLNLRSKQEKLFGVERINAVTFAPDGESFVVACGDLLTSFRISDGEELWSYRPPRSFGFLIISPVTVSISDVGEVAMATNAGKLVLFDKGGQPITRWTDNDSPRKLGYVGDRILGTDSFCVCLWDNAGRKVQKRALGQNRAYGMAISANKKRVCLRTIYEIQEIDPDTLDVIATYPVGYGLPLVDWSPDASQLAVSDVREVKIYKQGNGEIASLSTGGATIRSLAFSPNGQEIAAGCSDGSIVYWEVKV